jgi:hypothetical protein
LKYAKDTVFETTLNCLKDENVFILEMTERLQAGLSLYVYMTMREKYLLKNQKLDAPMITESSYVSQTIRKGYLEALAHTI